MKLSECLFTQALAGGTGAVDWTDDKRRRIFFLREGEIELVQSNLRSDSVERIAVAHPGVDGPELAAIVGRTRVSASLRETAGEARWVAGQPAPKQEPVSFADAIWAAGAPRPPIHAYLKASGTGASWYSRQMISPALAQYLAELDGTRTLDEVLGFSPSPPDLCERWVRIGLVIGALSDMGVESDAYEVRTLKAKRTWGAGTDDIASLIADGIGDKPPAPATSATDVISQKFGQILGRINEAADYFAVLGTTWKDPPETLRRAYFTLARDLHPDRYVEESPEVREAAAELFDRVRAAWETLGDESKRSAYIARVVHGEKTEEELAMEKVRAILDAESDFKRALSDFYAGRLAQAHELFVKCAERVPEEAEFAAYAGYTTWRIFTGRDEIRAEAGGQRLMDTVQNSEKLDAGWVLVGLMQRSRGDEQTARQSFINALKIKPSNPDALRELKRLEAKKQSAPTDVMGGFFGKFFGKKK